MSVTIVCDDSDNLALILYYINPCEQQIMKTASNVIDVGSTKHEIGPIFGAIILSVHVLTYCTMNCRDGIYAAGHCR